MTNLVTRWHEEQRDAYEREQLRLAYLRGPLPKNPPELLAPTKCKVLRPFCVGGKRVEIGEIVTLTRADAKSLETLRKVEILK
jgi:hypothetical protein